MPLNVYVILGSSGSGRRALLPHLVRDGLSDEELPAAILVWKGEPDHGPGSIPQALANTWFATYDFIPPAKGTALPAAPLALPALPDGTRTLFVIAPGSGWSTRRRANRRATSPFPSAPCARWPAVRSSRRCASSSARTASSTSRPRRPSTRRTPRRSTAPTTWCF